MKQKQKLLISFSGGKTSAYLVLWLITNFLDDYEIIVVFANTGQEREETLQFIRECDIYLGFKTVWIEAVVFHGQRKSSGYKIVNFETANRSGEPFEEVIKKYGIPNRDFPHCTRELKIRPIKAFGEDYFGGDYLTAIGIRADEVDRIQKGKFIFPLIKAGITKQFINNFWDNMPFTLPLKEYEGNCKKCHKKSLLKLIQIARDESEIGVSDNWIEKMEVKYSDFVPATQTAGRQVPIRFFRGNMAWPDIKELSAFSNDEIKQILKSREIEAEIPNGCSESCEAF